MDIKDSFINRKSYKHILRRSRTVNVITITGTIGSGKKTLASQLALYFSRRNYAIIPINDCEEIKHCCNPDENQVFIINDPFGTTNLDIDTFAKWSRYHGDISYYLENSSLTKMIFTCRLNIFKNEVCKSFDILYRNAINVSEGKFSSNWLHGPSFPLFNTFSGNVAETPLDIYMREITPLVRRNPDYALILNLVLIKKNKFSKYSAELRKDVEYVQDTFRIPISPILYFLPMIYPLLNEMDGSYLKETNGVYSFINNTVYDVLAYNAGLMSKRITIETCSREFFRNNLTFNRVKRNVPNLTLYLDDNDFDIWFERLVSEIENGRFLDIVSCSEFFERITKDLLLKKFKSLPFNELTCILSQTEHGFRFLDGILGKISFILREFRLKKGINFLCALLITGHYELFDTIWKIIEKSRLLHNFEKTDILRTALIGGNFDCLNKIVKTIWKERTFLPFTKLFKRTFYKRLLGEFHPICVSCACGHLNMVKYLLELGFDVNENDGNGNGALSYASRFGHERVVEYLISKGVNIDTQNIDGMSPIMFSVGNDRIFQSLLRKGASILQINNKHANVLMLACDIGTINVVENILEFCRNRLHPEIVYTFINKQDLNGLTALHKACQCQDNKTRLIIANLLLGIKANPWTADNIHSLSPLHLAAAQNDYELVRLLIDMADVNCTDNENVTPLFIAAENGFPKIVKVLLSFGADFTICRKTDGASPLLISAERGHLEVMKILTLKIHAIDYSEINCVNFENSTPLLMSTLNNHTKICEVLLENDADVNISNRKGYNPVLVASRNGNTKLIDLFLQRKADVNSQTISDKNTPLHLSAMMGHRRASLFLLSNGADVEKKNEQGLTPLVVATYFKQKEIVELLYGFRMYGMDFMQTELLPSSSPRTPSLTSSGSTSNNSSNNDSPYIIRRLSRRMIASLSTERRIKNYFSFSSELDTKSNHSTDNDSSFFY